MALKRFEERLQTGARNVAGGQLAAADAVSSLGAKFQAWDDRFQGDKDRAAQKDAQQKASEDIAAGEFNYRDDDTITGNAYDSSLAVGHRAAVRNDYTERLMAIEQESNSPEEYRARVEGLKNGFSELHPNIRGEVALDFDDLATRGFLRLSETRHQEAEALAKVEYSRDLNTRLDMALKAAEDGDAATFDEYQTGVFASIDQGEESGILTPAEAEQARYELSDKTTEAGMVGAIKRAYDTGGEEAANEKIRELMGFRGSTDTVKTTTGESIDLVKPEKETGVSRVLLLASLEVESNLNPKAVSKAGAKGVAQFMDETAAQYGVDVNDPQSSVNGMAAYYADLKEYFINNHGTKDIRFAIAAYNHGEGNVTAKIEKAEKALGKKNISFDELFKYLPKETQGHVNKVVSKMRGNDEYSVRSNVREAAVTRGRTYVNTMESTFAEERAKEKAAAAAFNKLLGEQVNTAKSILIDEGRIPAQIDEIRAAAVEADKPGLVAELDEAAEYAKTATEFATRAPNQRAALIKDLNDKPERTTQEQIYLERLEKFDKRLNDLAETDAASYAYESHLAEAPEPFPFGEGPEALKAWADRRKETIVKAEIHTGQDDLNPLSSVDVANFSRVWASGDDDAIIATAGLVVDSFGPERAIKAFEALEDSDAGLMAQIGRLRAEGAGGAAEAVLRGSRVTEKEFWPKPADMANELTLFDKAFQDLPGRRGAWLPAIHAAYAYLAQNNGDRTGVYDPALGEKAVDLVTGGIFEQDAEGFGTGSIFLMPKYGGREWDVQEWIDGFERNAEMFAGIEHYQDDGTLTPPEEIADLIQDGDLRLEQYDKRGRYVITNAFGQSFGRLPQGDFEERELFILEYPQ